VYRPFVQAAGVVCRGYSRPVRRAAVDFGADGSFAQAAAKMREHYGIELPVSAARMLTLQYAHTLTPRTALPKPGNVVPLQVIAELDGSMVPIVQRDSAAPDGRKGKTLLWKEARLCTVRRQGELTPVYSAAFGSVEEIGSLLKATARASGAKSTTRVHGVGDGAPWIAEQFALQFKRKGSYLLDLFHVCEYLAEAAAVCVAQSPADWLKHQKQRLLEGEVAAVFDALGDLQVPQGTTEKDDPVLKCLRYMLARRKQLNYAAALAKGLPVGSGEIEGAHRYIIQARLKRPGAWWTPSSAQAMLQLRVARANGQWDRTWQPLPLAA
jgi:hypothetical protein